MPTSRLLTRMKALWFVLPSRNPTRGIHPSRGWNSRGGLKPRSCGVLPFLMAETLSARRGVITCGGRSNPDASGEILVYPLFRALISLNLDSARSNLFSNSHIALRISRKVADAFALSACPKVKMLLLRKCPMIVGSEILYLARLPELRAALVGLGMI